MPQHDRIPPPPAASAAMSFCRLSRGGRDDHRQRDKVKKRGWGVMGWCGVGGRSVGGCSRRRGRGVVRLRGLGR
jgi:hypothetical protein